MKLSKEEIQYIANLARLELSEEEMVIYGEQLSHILDHIDQLQEVNTDGIEITAQVTGLVNIFREDEAREWDKDEAGSALKQSPEIESKQVKVKRILN
jgi:aspartyl-tRNA(Asn)/glutamyl-tRNA(Gln) amidotransferase subunit C